MIRNFTSSLSTEKNKQSASLKMTTEPVWRAVWEQLHLKSQLTLQQLSFGVKPMYAEQGTMLQLT